jgi:phage gp29-like protein
MPTRFQRLIRATQGRVARAIDRWTAPFDKPSDGYDPSRYVHISLAQSTDLSANRKGPPEGEYGDIPVSIWAEWTVRTIRSAVTQHALGTFGQSGLLVEGMMADDRVQSATNGRIKGVTKCDVMLKPAPVAGGLDVAQEIASLWVDMFPEETVEQLLQWSTFEGFALAEIIWEHRIKGDLWFPRLKVWHPLTIYYDIQRRQYVAITMEGPIYVSDDDPKWFLFTPYGSYRGWLRGGVRSCSIPWVVRQFALRDMARFSEKHGMPMLVAKVPAQAPAEDKARFFSSIRNLGAETGIQLPVQGGPDAASWDVQLLEAKDRSWEAFGGLRDMCDQAITLAIRGTNLTTQVDGGSYAAAESHRDEDSDFAVADRKKLASAIKRQLLDLFCFYNYGSQDLAPTLRFQAPRLEEEDKPADEAKTLLDVANAVTTLEAKGWPVDRAALAVRFNIPLIEGAALDVKPEEKPETNKPAEKTSQESSDEPENGESSRMAAE